MKHRYSALSRQPSRSVLASAITGTLLAALALPGIAQANDVLDAYQQQRQVQRAAYNLDTARFDVTPRAIASVRPNAEAPSPVLGNAGDPESWRTDEFKADWGLQAINADAAYARGLTGKGIRLGVFDSGTGLDHDEFAGKDHRSIHLADVMPDGTLCTNTAAVDGPDACFATDGDQVAIEFNIFDPSFDQRIVDLLNSWGYFEGGSYGIHGTHVSGTIAANRDGNGTHGVAFGADLSVARLFSNSVSYYTATPDGYLDVQNVASIGASNSIFPQLYNQLNEQGVRAVNHSWGLASEPNSEEDLDFYLSHPVFEERLQAIADGSRAKGMIQVWAAGNSGVNPSPEESPIAGMYASLPRAMPDIEKYWLAVVNVNQDLVLSNQSMRCGFAANWCLAAPGTEINSTVYGGDSQVNSDLYADDNGNLILDVLERLPTYSYGLLSGTSMATPHVTGALGLLFERFPYLDNAQVRDVLLTTATDLGAKGVDDVYGWGLMDLAKAIEGYGQLRVDTDVVMNQKAGGLKVWEGDAWDDWTNDIGGPGKLTKSGIGWLRLSGDNTFNGAIVREGVLELDGVNALTASLDVTGGQFLLNGTLRDMRFNSIGGSSRVTASGVLDNTDLTISGGVVSFNGVQTGGSTVVGAKGALQGIGRLGDTRVEGIIAPGNSIGTLTIDGDYVQTASGTYLAELAPGSRSDKLHVTGTASLDGTLKALPEVGIYYLGEQFNFLQADGGVNGTFANVDFSSFSPFLAFSLGYGANGVQIDVARGNALASAAVTANQLGVATSADSLGINQGLPKPLTQLFPAQVGAALDALSGELHAATPMALVESSRYLRDAALSRSVGARAPGAGDAAVTGAWVQAIGGSGKLDGDANAARTQSNTSGLLVGADHQFAGGWQVGGLIGTGRTDSKQAQGRRARAEIDNTHLGAYVGNQWGGFGLRAGLGYTRHEVDSRRELAFAGFQDALTARYDAKTRQLFVEGAYRIGGAEAGLEPYLQLARVEVDVDGVNEQGGAAALHGNVADTRTTIGTAGVRFDRGLKTAWQQESWLHVRGGVGYRRASGDRNQVANLALAGGSGYTVSGAAIADHAVVAELGLSAWLSPRNQLELGYNGQFGSESRDHGATARWSVQF
ncbi:autotransporter serine protease [Stenotrophomonas sp. 364]|uniref:autotransporter domain-containing protein n=1 Tax=Stenotrophomonas sp. 364 TaxID=2691571 RepID=UPI0013176476|nr:autotransporter serine protease [Stenotrophomonas sp. 364]QHB72696.1 autotransporter domain-containing protein [Stenotrophomonas sp. 364]